jgi:hypothetical protein
MRGFKLGEELFYRPDTPIHGIFESLPNTLERVGARSGIEQAPFSAT